MTLTVDMYNALYVLNRWYKKSTHQFIEVGCTIGTGFWYVLQEFIDTHFDQREILYLSYDQRFVLELAAKKYHAYFTPGALYHYDREVDFNSLKVINPHSDHLEYKWKKRLKKHIDPKYKLMVVFDSTLLSNQLISDIGSFGLPVILVRDMGLIPAGDSFTFIRNPVVELKEIQPQRAKDPIVHFANMALSGQKLPYGSYNSVNIISNKQMNLFNMKSADQILTMTDGMSDTLNQLYREKILKIKDTRAAVGERMVITSNPLYHKLVNTDEPRIKVYLARGTVGTLSKCNRHALTTKYIPVEFKADFYDEPFTDLYIDRFYLNGIENPSRQAVPDEVVYMRYAYSLSVVNARLSHWDRILFVNDPYEAEDLYINKLMYTAISKARKQCTIVY